MSNFTNPAMPSRHPVRHPAGGRTSIYLVRHGRTNGNVQRLLCGWTDVPMDAHGVAQAGLIADRLAAVVPADVLLASPLSRARVTAGAIGERMGLTPHIRPDLIEWNFGAAEGLSFETVAELYPETAIRFTDIHDFDVGWPGGETRRQFHDRVYGEFLSILHTYHDHTLVIVAHGGVIGSLLAQIQGRSPNDWFAYDIHNCSLTHMEVLVDETAIHLLNDIEHLDGLIEPNEESTTT
jgi:broad specificity phosphatase PhoE